jgi:hypothetical protein
MIKIVFFLILIILNASNCFGQVKGSNGINYAQPLQVDSSEYFILGSQVNKSNKLKYNLSVKNQYEDYDGQHKFWTNIFILNSNDKKVKKIFDTDLVAVYPVLNTMLYVQFDNGFYESRRMNSGISTKYIVYLARTDEFNKDGIIDDDDPVYIFISTKNGEHFKQITPNGMNVTNWKLSRDGNTIIATIQKDNNSDKKFADEDEIVYQIDLDNDISKIKPQSVTL